MVALRRAAAPVRRLLSVTITVIADALCYPHRQEDAVMASIHEVIACVSELKPQKFLPVS
jgi:hypothetical protein